VTLTRDNVTAASRIMLPTYVVFFAAVGLNYLLANGTAAATPALAYVNAIMPLPVWGGLFATCAALMALALIRGRRTLYRFALRYCAFAMILWAIVITLASLVGEATPLAAVWSAFVATACLASDRSLKTGES
jgi:hypothetical protein